MTDQTSLPQEYLVISRGQWDPALPPEHIERAIEQFYRWHDRLVQNGHMRAGQRLAREGRLVSKASITDGPFSEAKEVIGGYWFILASSLDKAAGIAAENPCLACGLSFEVRPIEMARASAYATTTETPFEQMGTLGDR